MLLTYLFSIIALATLLGSTFGDSVQALGVPIMVRGRNMTSALVTKSFQQTQQIAVLTRWGSEEVKSAILRKRQEIPLGQQNAGTGLNEYLAQVSFGTPAQTFSLILDTGSSDVWVVDPSCASCTPSTPAFNAPASSTYQSSNYQVDLEYGSLSALGYAAADTISMANYTVTSQTFILVNRISPGSLSLPCSGILGLAWQSLTTTGATPWWQLLAVEGALKKNVFTFQMARNSVSSDPTVLQPGGIFTLGELDNSQFSGSPTYIKLLSETYWTIPLDGITIQGTANSLPQGQNTAIIDTGTALLITPVAVARNIYAQIPGSRLVDSQEGFYAIPCNANVDIALVFGGKTFAINPRDMLNGALNDAGTFCLGGIVGQSLGQGSPDYIVGSTFLKNVFTIFDFDEPSVGFAALLGNNAQTISSTAPVNAGQSVAATGRLTTAVSPTDQPRLPPFVSSDDIPSSTLTSIQGGTGLSAPAAVSTGPSQDSSNSATWSIARGGMIACVTFTMITLISLII